jgi:hypothetical protein
MERELASRHQCMRCGSVIARSGSDEAIYLFPRGEMDCFAALAMAQPATELSPD